MSNKTTGDRGEQLAESTLNGLGLEMIEKIGTPVKLSQYFDHRGSLIKGVFRVIFGERVSGDRRAILPDGTSVLVEVKTCWDENLAFSQLEPHQHAALARHASYGNALSLLVYVHNSGVYVMDYPAEGIPGFVHRKSITPEMASRLDRETREYIANRIGS